MNATARLEALLFAADQPLSLARLCEVLEGVERLEVEAALDELEAQYAASERAFHLVRVAGGFQLTTKPEYAALVRRLYTGKRKVRLTKPALEALAIVAYKQPTTRPEVDAIRGVASGGVIETLLERNLVRIAGRSEGVGRPLLYATTTEFLEYLGLDTLADLPSLQELEALLNEREAQVRLEEEAELAEYAREPEAEAEAAPAARLDTLPSLDALDAELHERTAHIERLSATLLAERERHVATTLDPADAADANEVADSEPPSPAPPGP